MAEDAEKRIKTYGIEIAVKQKCSDDHRIEIAQFISWKEVGCYLPGINRKTDLEDIEKEGRNEAERRLKLVDLWENTNGDGATYEAMIVAMCKARKVSDATKVCNMLQPVPTVASASTSIAPIAPTFAVVEAVPPLLHVLPVHAVTAPGRPLGPRGSSLADSPGLAVLVTCDYESNKSLNTLKGTREDAKEMRKTFNHLNYVVRQLENATKAEIMSLLNKISEELSSYKGDPNKVIVCAFSGHGGNDQQAEQIYANDGQKLDLKDEIVLSFVQHEAVAKIPKLFFIDACRGSDVLTKGAGDVGEKSVKPYFTKGFQRVEGNYRIDYSTIPDHVSYGGSSGSIWMLKLARALREQVNSFQNIADNVKKEVHDELEKMGQKKQQCESVSRLNCGELYLQKY